MHPRFSWNALVAVTLLASAWFVVQGCFLDASGLTGDCPADCLAECGDGAWYDRSPALENGVICEAE